MVYNTLWIVGIMRHILKSIKIWTVFVACLKYIFHVHLGRHCLERGGPFWLDQFLSINFNAGWPVCLVLCILIPSVVDLPDFRLETSTIQLPRLYKDTSHWQKNIISACCSLDWVQPKPRGFGVTLMLISNQLFSFWFALVWANRNHKPQFSASFKCV